MREAVGDKCRTVSWRLSSFPRALLPLIAALILAQPSVPANADNASIAWVAAFVERSEAAVAGDRSRAQAQLVSLYTRYFDLPGLAARVAPAGLWAASSRAQKRQFIAFLACEMAAETRKRSRGQTANAWQIIGTRRSGDRLTVAVRFDVNEAERRTAMFDVAPTRAGRRIVDLRSERGRLSRRLAEDIARRSQNALDPPRPDRWLKMLKCG